MKILSKYLGSAALFAGLLASSGCGYLFGTDGVFRDTSEDYKKAPETAAIRVPEGKNDGALQEIYPIPPIQEELVLEGDFEVPRPSPLVAGAGDQLVRIQKLGDDSWAVVAEAPGQVRAQVRGVFGAAGIGVVRADARSGVMETGWLELEGRSMSSRFQVRIDQGVQRGTSELHVLQMNQAGDIRTWPSKSDSLEQEAEMLKALSQYIADSSGAAPVSMIADQAISASGKISMQESPAGYTYIDLDLPYDRAWASLGRALPASSFEVTDRNRSTGIYYAVFMGLGSEEEGGWFDWLWDSEEEQPHVGDIFVISVDKLSEQSVSIRMRPQDPQLTFDKREEQALLSLIKGNIN